MSFLPPSEGLAEMAALLERSDQYRILRRLGPPPRFEASCADPSVRVAAFVDVETTGLDPVTDRIIELAIMSFAYSPEGRILGVCDSFEAFQDPDRTIPSEVTSLTGITDEMVAGKRIDPACIAELLAPVALVCAHNSRFDRPFCERLIPIFAEKPWACSLQDVAWVAEGFVNGTKLSNLASSFGFFFDGHRAVDDCRAGVALLSGTLPASGRPVMAALLESARRPRWRIRAAGAPYAHRARLKQRGYRWHDGADGRPRAWFVDVLEEARDAEIDFLRRQIYCRENIAIDMLRITAADRYSARC
jgi:DNA polymerase-3 subunit epsilon